MRPKGHRQLWPDIESALNLHITTPNFVVRYRMRDLPEGYGTRHGVHRIDLVEAYASALQDGLNLFLGANLNFRVRSLPIPVFVFNIDDLFSEPFPVTFR